MAGFELVCKRSVQTDLQALPAAAARSILSRMAALADDPRPATAKRLTNREHYRLRQGMYRIVYAITPDRLVITAITSRQRCDADGNHQ